MEFFGYFSLFTVLKYLCKRKFSFFLGSLTVCLKISKPPPETVDSNSMCFSPHPHPLYEVCDQRFHNFSKVLLAPKKLKFTALCLLESFPARTVQRCLRALCFSELKGACGEAFGPARDVGRAAAPGML